MTIQNIQFKGFNRDNSYNNYLIVIGDNTYSFIIRWLDYCDCAFLNINDEDGEPIISGKALVNNLKIRNNLLPYAFMFVHINNETYEPTIDNIAEEFALIYDDGEEE